MTDGGRFYIDGQWVEPAHPGTRSSSSTRRRKRRWRAVAAASSADVDAAVQAAHRAFPSWSQTSREERIELLTALREAYKKRIPQIAEAMMTEVGIPRGLAFGGQVLAGARHLKVAMDALRDYPLGAGLGHHAHPARAGGRVRPARAVELADEPGDLQGRPGAGRRLHHGAQAEPALAALRARVRRRGGRGRLPRRRVQHAQRRRRGARRRVRHAPARRHGLAHRLDRRGRRGRRRRRAVHQARLAGARRQVRQHRVRRRERREGRPLRHASA